MEVRTEQYEFSHGKAPRGMGSWAFSFRKDGAWTEPVFYHQQTYTNAKRKAITDARVIHASEIRVEP